MDGTWLLVHPPLLGPAVLGPLAAELRRRGAEVAVPDLRARVQDPASPAPSAAGWDRRWAAGAGGRADVVVGFSGAGIVLPAVAAAVGAGRVVWLDAVLPPAPGTARWPADVRERVAPLTGDDGRVADWTTWWGPDAMRELLPDEEVRTAVLAEGHRLPADLWSTGVAVPPLTAEPRYVHLSPAYDADAAEARARGWPVAGDGRGGHLDVATDPATTAGLLG
ncbi:hypothetical protein [Geodermatophilus sp. SYSU D00696]